MSDDLSKYGFIPDEAGASAPGKDNYGFVPETKEEEAARLEAENYDHPVVASLAGAARGVSMGLSDLAGRAVGLDDELEKLKKYNPKASIAGEIGGVAVGTFFEGPGALLAAGARRATTGIASKVLAKVAAGAIEGAVYGAGQTVSEASLTQEPLKASEVAEHLLANVSVGALFGGGFSLGADIAGRGASALKGKVSKIFTDVTENSVERANAILGEHGSGIVPGIDPNFANKLNTAEREVVDRVAQRLNEAERELNVPLTQGTKSGAKLVQQAESYLSQQPTIAGAKVAKETNEMLKGLSEAADVGVLGERSGQSALEAGEELKSLLITEIKGRREPIGKVFDSIRESAEHIEVPEAARNAVAKNLLEEQAVRVSPKSEPASIFSRYADDIKNLRTIDDVSFLRSQVGSEAQAARASQNFHKADALEVVKEKLTEMRSTWFENAAKTQAASPVEGKAIAEDILGQLSGANKDYAKLSQLTSDVARGAKFGNSKSIGGFIKKLETTNGEQLVKKLWQKENYRLLEKLQGEFPEVFEKLRRYKLGELYQDSIKDNVLNLNALARQTRKMEPELRRALFGTSGERTLDNIEVVLAAMPKKLNPSETSLAQSFKHFFSVGGFIQNGTDEALRRTLKAAPIIQRAITEQNKAISSSLGQFLLPLARGAQSTAVKGILVANEDHLARINRLAEISSNPEKLVGELEKNTKGLQSVDEDIHASLTTRAVDAINFLQSKAPKNPGMSDMFGKDKWKPSNTEIAKWNRYVRAVDNPLSVLDDLKARVLTPEAVEAVRTVYPELFVKIRERAIDVVSKHKGELKYQDKAQLEILLGLPVSSLGSKKLIKSLQEDFPDPSLSDAEVKQGGAPAAARHPSAKGFTNSEAVATPLQRTLNR